MTEGHTTVVDDSPPARHTRSSKMPTTNGTSARVQEKEDMIKQLKKESSTYHEVGKVVDAIQALWRWRELEDDKL